MTHVKMAPPLTGHEEDFVLAEMKEAIKLYKAHINISTTKINKRRTCAS